MMSAKQESKRYRSVVLLTLMVLVPVVLLSYFGIRLQSQESELIEADFNKLIGAQLQTVDGQFATYFESLDSQLQSHLTLISRKDPMAIRELLSSSAYIRNVFIATPEGERVFPPEDNLSSDELAFLQRTRSLWLEPQIFDDQAEAQEADVVSNSLARRSYLPKLRVESQVLTQDLYASSEQGAPLDITVAASGWHTLYADTGTRFIYWMRDADRTLYAFELLSTRIISDLINSLPSAGDFDASLNNASIQLGNEKGETLYQWGGYSIGEESPRKILYLNPPLGSWKLAYYSESIQYRQQSQALNLFLVIAAIALVLTGLALYFYREQFREISLARQRVNFVNQISHELKTPLTNIRMYAELMEKKAFEDADLQRHARVITTESQRLSRLIENVLSFSRSQRSDLKVHKQPNNADELITRVIQAFAPMMENANIEVSFSGHANDVVNIDAEILEQILTNLLSNAEKYAAEGQRVNISSRMQGDQLEVIVQDYGSGIAEEYRGKIFESFYRISSKLTDGVAGTGIGLSIARELARLHGGDLTLQDAPQGCCFKLTLNGQE